MYEIGNNKLVRIKRSRSALARFQLSVYWLYGTFHSQRYSYTIVCRWFSPITVKIDSADAVRTLSTNYSHRLMLEFRSKYVLRIGCWRQSRILLMHLLNVCMVRAIGMRAYIEHWSSSYAFDTRSFTLTSPHSYSRVVRESLGFE